MSLLTRLLNVFRPGRLERELKAEIQFHLDRSAERLLEGGMDSDDAAADALRQFGDVDRVMAGMKEARVMNRSFVGGVLLGIALTLAAMLSVHLGRQTQVHEPEGFFLPGQDGVEGPVVIHEEKPSYPPDAMKAKIAGSVLLQCVVKTDGTCSHAHITRPLAPELDRAALTALDAWRFQPATQNGRAVSTLVTIEIAYTLLADR